MSQDMSVLIQREALIIRMQESIEILSAVLNERLISKPVKVHEPPLERHLYQVLRH
jgi:hypothetical protein